MEYQKFNDQRYQELVNGNLPTANIIVAGITGTGKSTLINAVFGSSFAKTGTGQPITQNMNAYSSPDIPIRIWDTVGLELDAKRTEDSIDKIRQTIAKKASSSDQFDRIHAIWYCINSGSSRYQEAELDFIKKLHKINVPFIIVMTQCIADEDTCNQLETEIRKINRGNEMDDIEVVQVLAQDYKTRGICIPAFGLDDLVNLTTEKMPEFVKNGFLAAQRVDVVQKRMQCEAIIIQYVKAAKEGFWDKVPIINMFTTNDAIIRMFEKIGKMYNAVLSADRIKQVAKESKLLGFDFVEYFKGLLNPNFSGFKAKVSQYLEELRGQDGFEVEMSDFSDSERAARMIAFYGYTYVLAIEEIWNKATEEEMKNVEHIAKELVRIIKQKLQEVKGGNNGYR